MLKMSDPTGPVISNTPVKSRIGLPQVSKITTFWITGREFLMHTLFASPLSLNPTNTKNEDELGLQVKQINALRVLDGNR